jgi:hypothetical protein
MGHVTSFALIPLGIRKSAKRRRRRRSITEAMEEKGENVIVIGLNEWENLDNESLDLNEQ